MVPRRTLAPVSFLVLLALVLVSGGCAKKPTMKLNHAEVSGVSFGFPPTLAVVMTVVVDVYNPNSYDVAVRAMRGTVTIADKYPLPIDFRVPGDGVWLPADRTTPLRVPVNIPVQLGTQLLQEAYGAQTIPFKISGRADVTATRTFKIEKDDYAVDEQGTMSRQQVEAAMRSVFNPFGMGR